MPGQWQCADADRRAAPPSPYRCVITLRHIHDEAISIGIDRRLTQACKISIRAAKADVVGDRACEQRRFLRHQPHHPAQIGNRRFTRINAADQHLA